jgi:hypothetical protein
MNSGVNNTNIFRATFTPKSLLVQQSTNLKCKYKKLYVQLLYERAAQKNVGEIDTWKMCRFLNGFQKISIIACPVKFKSHYTLYSCLCVCMRTERLVFYLQIMISPSTQIQNPKYLIVIVSKELK